MANKCPVCGADLSAGDCLCSVEAKPLPPAESEATAAYSDSNRTRPAPPPAANDGRYLPGQVVVGRYLILSRVGKGGMGEVYEVLDRERNARVALKVLPQLNPASLFRFKQEFRALADIVHPHLVPLYELVAEGDQWFFTMELLDGVDFLTYVRAKLADDQDASTALTAPNPQGTTSGQNSSPTWPRDEAPISTTDLPALGPVPSHPPSPPLRKGGQEGSAPSHPPSPPLRKGGQGGSAPAHPPSLPLRKEGQGGSAPAVLPSAPLANFDRLRAVLRQLAEGLYALHSAWKLHRDIKPSNVIVCKDGRVVLLDFGLVAEMGVTTLPEVGPTGPASASESVASYSTLDQHVVGTVGYMAPEQADGKTLTPACDWYAVGVTLYQALTGVLPYQGSAQQILRAKLTADPVAPATLVAGIPEDLDTLCTALLCRDPAGRPTGAEILARLRRGPADVGPAWDLRPPKRSVSFVGRESHLAVLRAAFARMLAGETVTVELTGKSGTGKSALVQHFLDGVVQREGTILLAGRCREQESVPYKALDSLVDTLTRYLLGLSRYETDALLPADVAALARVFPVLQRVDAVAEAPRDALAIPDPQEVRRRAFAAFRELLTRLGRRHALILHIDDLQWGDLDSVALLGDLLRPPDAPRLLLLLSYRSEDAQSSVCLQALRVMHEEQAADQPPTVLAVDPLTPAESRKLARQLLGDRGPDTTALADRIVQEAAGNPYFIDELTRHLQRGAHLTAYAGMDLDTVLWEQVQRLPEVSRRLLEVVAVAGQPLRLRNAYEAAELKTLEPQVVVSLRFGHLVRGTGPSPDDDIETYHDRIRETVVAHLPAEVRKGHHGRLAVSLEAAGRADPEQLAVHFHQSDQGQKAGHYYALAADQAADALAFDRAAKLYRLALEVRPVTGGAARLLRGKLGDALANAGRSIEAAREYHGAAADAGPAEQLELERRAAYQFCIGGHVDEGREAFRTVLGRVGMSFPGRPLWALASLLRGRFMLTLRGIRPAERKASQATPAELLRIDICWSAAIGLTMVDTIRGADFETRNLLLALKAGEPYRIARALAFDAAHVATAGRTGIKRSRKLLEAAETMAKQIDHPHALAMTLLMTGATAYHQGQWSRAQQFCERAQAILRAQCRGVTWELDTAHTFNLWSVAHMGRFSEMVQRTPVLLKEAEDRGDLFAVTNLGTYMEPLVRLAADDAEGGREACLTALGRWTQKGYHIQHITALMGQTFVDLYAGQGEAAWRRISEHWAELARSLFLRVHVTRSWMLHLRACSAIAAAAGSARPGPLLSAARADARRLKKERMPWCDALARLVEACADAAEGNKVRAAEQLATCAKELDILDMGLLATAARRRLGGLLGGERGRGLVAAADAWMAKERIQNPARMTALCAPGAFQG